MGFLIKDFGIKKGGIMITSRYVSNPNGIPRFESNSVNVSTTNVVFAFTSAGSLFNNNFNGLVLIKFNQVIPTDTTTTLPILINTIPLMKYSNTEATVADFKGTGIYLAYYDSSSKTLQLLTGD